MSKIEHLVVVLAILLAFISTTHYFANVAGPLDGANPWSHKKHMEPQTGDQTVGGVEAKINEAELR